MEEIEIIEGLAASYAVASRSEDKSNQIGAVILDGVGRTLSEGYNHIPIGVPPTNERPAKYERTLHAEAHACLRLHQGYSPGPPQEMIMYCSWTACKQCALSIIGAGITTLVTHSDRHIAYGESRTSEGLAWKNEFDEALTWIKDSRCEVIFYEGPVPTPRSVLVNGVMWSPNKNWLEDPQDQIDQLKIELQIAKDTIHDLTFQLKGL